MSPRKDTSSKPKKSKSPNRRRRPTTPCTIPEAVDPVVLNAFAPQPKDETDAIKSYVELEELTYPCPSCGFLVFEEPAGSYNVCPICNWEDDHVQLRHPLMGE